MACYICGYRKSEVKLQSGIEVCASCLNEQFPLEVVEDKDYVEDKDEIIPDQKDEELDSASWMKQFSRNVKYSANGLE
jgi:hypothetical protein